MPRYAKAYCHVHGDRCERQVVLSARLALECAFAARFTVETPAEDCVPGEHLDYQGPLEQPTDADLLKWRRRVEGYERQRDEGERAGRGQE